MKKTLSLILCVIPTVLMAGCVKTYTYKVERKDQDLVGNRGIIQGETPRPLTGRKRMRTMGGVDVELHPSEEYKVKKKALEEGAQPQGPLVKEEEEEEVRDKAVVKLEIPEKKTKGFADEQWVKEKEVKEIERKTPAAVRIEYTIKEGDTFEKIAKNFYGDSSKWTMIYDENKNIIKDPSRIYPGQVIVIPQIEPEEEGAEGAFK